MTKSVTADPGGNPTIAGWANRHLIGTASRPNNRFSFSIFGKGLYKRMIKEIDDHVDKKFEIKKHERLTYMQWLTEGGLDL